MADNQSDKQNSAPSAAESLAPPTPAEAFAPAPSADQVAELKELTLSLLTAVRAAQEQGARNAEIHSAISNVEAATRAMLLSPPVPAARHEVIAQPGKEDCGCSPCSCVSERCCVFDIVMTHVRVVDMQIEPVDSNLFDMEVNMFASVDGIGAVIPDQFGYLTLHKLVNKPGVWTQVCRTINTVYVCKGNPKTITINLDVCELEKGLVEQVTALRDEYGTASQTMTLECCCSTAPVVTFEVHLTGGGQGGGTIEGRFTAVKKC